MTNLILFRRTTRCLTLTAAVTLLASPGIGFSAQPAAAPMVSLPGNVRPEVRMAKDEGAVDSSMQLDHMLLQLQRPAAREAALEAKIESMHEPSSPDFHH